MFGPHRTLPMIICLCVLGLLQVMEPRVLAVQHGNIISFGFKLLVVYQLMGWTDGIASSYFWMLLLPVATAATTMSFMRGILATALACLAYISFLYRIP